MLPEFHVAEPVYHVTDLEAEAPGVVVALVYYKDFLLYKVQWLGSLTEHQAFELQREKPVSLQQD